MVQAVFPLFGGIPGGPELLVVLLIAVLLFGANKIPKLARSTGEAMGEFQKGREEVEQELQEMREGKSAEEQAAGTSAESVESETVEEGEPVDEAEPVAEAEPAEDETDAETDRT